MSFCNIERQIEGSIISGLRAFFYTIDKYKYEEEDSLVPTKIYISSDYPFSYLDLNKKEKKAFSIPIVSITDISYAPLMMAIGNGEIARNDVTDTTTYSRSFNFSASIQIGARENSTSKDITSLIAYFLDIKGYDMIREELCLTIDRWSKMSRGYTPVGNEKMFSNVISLSGSIQVETIDRPIDPTIIAIARKFHTKIIKE